MFDLSRDTGRFGETVRDLLQTAVAFVGVDPDQELTGLGRGDVQADQQQWHQGRE